MKYCINCKHFWDFGGQAICAKNMQEGEPDPIYGIPKWEMLVRARWARENETHCGKDAKFFEPK